MRGVDRFFEVERNAEIKPDHKRTHPRRHDLRRNRSVAVAVPVALKALRRDRSQKRRFAAAEAGPDHGRRNGQRRSTPPHIQRRPAHEQKIAGAWFRGRRENVRRQTGFFTGRLLTPTRCRQRKRACNLLTTRRGYHTASRSGRVTKISTPSITMVMRNAASCPFQVCDCHMAKYSPATTRKPENQRPKPAVKPATAQILARLKRSAGALSRVSNASAPIRRRRQINPSAAMIAA